MSVRCQVCNTTKIPKVDKLNSNTSWECQTCGNLVDANGLVVSTT